MDDTEHSGTTPTGESTGSHRSEPAEWLSGSIAVGECLDGFYHVQTDGLLKVAADASLLLPS